MSQTDNPDSLHPPSNPQEQEELFRLVQEFSPYGFAILHPERDATGRIVDLTWLYVNPAFARLTGFPPAQLIGQRLLHLFPSSAGSPFFAAFLQVAETGQPTVVEHSYQGESFTSPTWFRATAVRVGEDVAILIQDITARKHTETALRESEERYRTLFDSMTEGFLICEMIFDSENRPTDLRVLNANRALEKQAGVRLPDVLGKLVSEGVGPIEPIWLERYGLVVQRREPQQFTAYSAPLDRWFEVYAFPLQTPNCFGVMNRDVTERQRAEQALRQNEEKYRLLFENMTEMFQILEAVFDTDGNVIDYRYIEVNHATETLAKSSRQDIEGKTVRQLWGSAEADWLQMLEKVLRTGEPLRTQNYSNWLGVFCDVFAWKLNDHRVAIVISDITQRKQDEANFRALLNAAPALVWACKAPTGETVYFNDTWYEYTGQTREQSLGYGWTEVAHPDDWKRLKSLWQRCQITGEPYAGEARYRRKDGQYRWFTFRALPTRNQQGQLESWFGASIDIHDQRQAESTASALREADKQKDDFLAMLGHELRNPLAAVTTALQVLPGASSPAQRIELEEIMTHQLSIMQRLLDDLLDLARITHGHLELRKEPIELRTLLSEAALSINSSFSKREQQLRVTSPAASLEFMADPIRLQQVLGNLLSNACKYTPRGGQIELSGGREGSELVLRCKDNGQGIPPEVTEQIFEPFNRGGITDLSYGEASLGLGLAMARQLVQLHGGSITASSPGPGLGSEFTVRLPFLAPPAPTSLTFEPSPSPPPAGRLIVVVEDNPTVAQVMTMGLQQSGHQPHVFSDGASVLAAIHQLQPDAILLDIGLPDMNGYELASRLRQQPHLRNTTFIALSGFPERPVDDDHPKVFDHYLVKPVDMRILRTLLVPRPPTALRVLLVEDHAELGAATVKQLQAARLEVRLVATGREALGVAPGFRPHIILCDMHLPDLGGLDVIRSLKSTPDHGISRSIIVSGLSKSEIQALNKRADKMGVDEFVSKPLTPEFIRQLVSTASSFSPVTN